MGNPVGKMDVLADLVRFSGNSDHCKKTAVIIEWHIDSFLCSGKIIIWKNFDCLFCLGGFVTDGMKRTNPVGVGTRKNHSLLIDKIDILSAGVFDRVYYLKGKWFV